jgi:DNA repair exonuclease SbcCD ATPase subunit
MRLAKLQTVNWGPYRDQNDATVSSGVYAVAAARVDDPTRSNWQGKSMFVETIRFLLFGSHHFDVDDQWITKGENAGGVKGVLSDGTAIERTKKRGSSTNLIVTLSDGKKLRGGEAQKRIEELVGMNEKTFLSSAFFEQKQISKLVRMAPGERVKLVEEWFELAPLVKCEKQANDEVSSANAEVAESVTRIDEKSRLVKELEDEIEAGFEYADDVETELSALVSEMTDAEARATKARDELSTLADWRREYDQAVAFDEASERSKDLNARLKKLRSAEEIEEDLENAQSELASLNSSASLKKDAVRKLKVVAAGEFDGNCPVAGRECPVRAEINSDRASTRARLKDAETAAQGADTAVVEIENRIADLSEEKRDREDIESKLTKATGTLRANKAAKAKIKKRGVPPSADSLKTELDEATTLRIKAGSRQKGIAQDLERIEKTRVEIEALEVKKAEALKDARIWTRAAASFRRARKLLAERELKRIEVAANELVRAAAIPLSIALEWERPGKGLATHCDKCGTTFPKSQKVKECESCGAKRGPKMIERLDVNLSDTSGAAEDIAGVAIQLAVSKWIRARRGSAWSVVVIDEPFGALDECLRGALSKHLATMLRSSFGFEQAFVISHDTQTSGAMPNRIQITGHDDRSTFEVAC